jgi:hypothetical protein
METVILKRTHTNVFETLGELIYKGVVVAKTLELPWRNNTRRVSCIPEGTYLVIIRSNHKYGLHFHVTQVPSRSYILIHHANYYSDLLGCIGVGQEHVDIDKDGLKDVNHSRRTMKILLKLLPEKFELKIIS